jgi:GT2 family glycosyltransferase
LAITPHVVYVDSASTDGSVHLARALGAEPVELGKHVRFTAALARNIGFNRLTQVAPDLEFVQFVDGDCELAPGWVDQGLAHFRAHPNAVVACGRRRERHPDASIYNRLCDMEWNTPVGLAQSCGGDFLMRAAAFEAIGGFAPELIAGEEPDLCARLRDRGCEIWRLDAEMTRHDADMTRFEQWWWRNVRSGHAYAEALSRRSGAADSLKPVVSNVAWAMPVAWVLWPFLWWRVYRRHADYSYATFLVLGKLPHFQGQVKYWADTLRGRDRRIIEYR